jgi:hypothetical protein
MVKKVVVVVLVVLVVILERLATNIKEDMFVRLVFA